MPDLDRALEFYRALFGWTYAPRRGYATALVDDLPVAAITADADLVPTERQWNVYLATDDCDGTARRVAQAGGTVLSEPTDVMEQGRAAQARDPVGAWFGLWQGYRHPGCQVVNEPNSLVRNDLVTPHPEPARTFYAKVFDFTLERNAEMPDFDFTFLRRPDGHEVAGIFGLPDAPASVWSTTFEVADTDAAVASAVAAGGTASEPQDMLYGRIAQLTDRSGTEFSIIARPAAG